MNDLPRLSATDIESQLEKHYGFERHHHLFAFYGTGSETRISPPRAGTFDIVPVESELDFRDKLTHYEDPGARAVFLVPWNTEVPLDLRGRFARQGKVLRIGASARLQRMFRVAEVDEEARRSPLADYLLKTDPTAVFASTGGRLTEAKLWQTWLAQRYRLDVPGEIALDTLLGWAASEPGGAKFVEAMAHEDAAGVRDAMLAHFQSQLGHGAGPAWVAWEGGAGVKALQLAVLCESLASSQSGQVWLRQKVRQVLSLGEEVDALAVANDFGDAAAGALLYYSRSAGAPARGKLLNGADALMDEPSLVAELSRHERLPSAWRARLDALGHVLADAAGAPSEEMLARAVEALENLESHELFPAEQETNRVKSAVMAVRLLAWLVERSDKKTEGQLTPHGDAVALGSWYASEGGYLDWARGFARGTTGGAFGKGVQAVVEAVDGVRAGLDARFAKGLKAWVEAKRPSAEIVPIDHALKRIAVPFLEEDESRKLLVLLMDGMAWAQAVELLQSMGERSMAWGPLNWHSTAKGRIGREPLPAVMATLPTITEVSRAAFFAGKAMGPGEKKSTQNDPKRFEGNSLLAPFCEGNTAPKLFLRAEGSTKGGAVTEEALSLVADSRRRVVGLVVNAIDASLKRDPQQHPRWGVNSIRPLADLLDAAHQAERAILIASDHGHVPTDNLQSGEPSGGGARWRPWEGEGDSLAEGEMLFAGDGVWAPKGAEGVVLLTEDRRRYGSAPNAGEHGGASLAEVVAPCFLIGSATQAAYDDDDVGQRVVGATVPGWWLLRTGHRDEVEEPRPRKKRRVEKPSNQLPLPVGEPPAKKPKKRRPSVVINIAAHPLAASKLFDELTKKKKAEQEQVLRAVDFLRERHGAATVEAFAAAMGEIGWRVPGLVSKLQGVLNVDGYQVLWFDPVGKQVRLDVVKLEQQFEIKL